MMSSRIFVSHSSQDKDIANRVLDYLESNGQQCWIAPRDIPPGADWAESIIDGIDTSSAMILVVTPRLNDSPHIRREVERAVSNKIPIIPLIVEQTKFAKWVQYYISAHQWVDATDKSLFEKAMLDISEKLASRVLTSSIELDKDLTDESSQNVFKTSLNENSTGRESVVSKRRIFWRWGFIVVALLACLYAVDNFNIWTTSDEVNLNNETADEVNLNCETVFGSNRQYDFRFDMLQQQSVKLSQGFATIIPSFARDQLYLALWDYDLNELASTIVPAITFECEHLSFCPVADDEMVCFGSGTLKENTGIGMFEFGLDGEFKNVSILNDVWGDSVVAVVCHDIARSGDEIFTIACLVEISCAEQDSIKAVLTTVTRDGEFVSSQTIMSFQKSSNNRRRYSGDFQLAEVSNGILAVSELRQYRDELESITVFWIDSTGATRNTQTIEVTSDISGIVSFNESNIHGGVLTLSSPINSAANGTFHFIWFSDEGNIDGEAFFDSPQRAFSFGGAVDLAFGDFICTADMDGGIVLENIEHIDIDIDIDIDVDAQFSSNLSSEINLLFPSLSPDSTSILPGPIIGNDTNFYAQINMLNNQNFYYYLAKMSSNGDVNLIKNIGFPIFLELWSSQADDFLTRWNVSSPRRGANNNIVVINEFGNSNCISLDLNGNYFVSKDYFPIMSSLILECDFWVSSTANSDSLAFGFLPTFFPYFSSFSNNEYVYRDSEPLVNYDNPLAISSPRFVWSKYGDDSGTIEASYFNGREFIECRVEPGGEWLGLEEWNHLEILFTSSTAVFMINGSFLLKRILT